MGLRDYDDRSVWASVGFEGGLAEGYPKHVLDPDQAADAENFDPSRRFQLVKRFGSSNFTGDHGTPTGTIIRGFCIYAFENGTVKLVAKEGTAVYDVTAGNWSTTITGHPALSDADEVHFAMFRNLLIMCSEETAPISPQKWSGSGAFSNLGGSAPNAMYPCVHKGRLWMARTQADPSIVYFSALNNAEDWTTADNSGNFYVNAGDGYVINGIASDGDVLYISKISNTNNEGAIYAVFGTGPTDFQPPRRIAWFGAVSHRAFTITNSYIAVATHRGIYGLQGNRLVYMNDAFNDRWINSITKAQRAVSVSGWFQNQMWVAYPDSGSTNSKAFVCDILYGRWSRYSQVACRIFATHPDGTLFGAHSSSGTIRITKYNDSSQNQDVGSIPVTQYWVTPNLDFGQWYSDKKPMEMWLHVDASQTVTWTITQSLDDAAFGDSQTMVSNTEGPVKKIIPARSRNQARFVRYKIEEASTSTQGKAFGIMVGAEVQPRTR